MQKKHDEIAALIINFCDAKINTPFKNLCLHLLKGIYRECPSLLLGGRSHTWAAGIVYAVAQDNGLFHNMIGIRISSTELASSFGISAGSAGRKAHEIREMFDIDFFQPFVLLWDNKNNVAKHRDNQARPKPPPPAPKQKPEDPKQNLLF